MRRRTELPPAIDVDVTTRGELPGAAEYARRKIGELGRLTHRPVLHTRVKLTRHGDPAVERPVVAQANLDVDGRLVRAQVEGVTAHEAIDRLEARLRHRLERAAEHWEARRGELPATGPDEWRHESEPTHRPSYFPRPADERRVIRRKSFTMAPCTVDEAALEMDQLDYDFHLFTEKGTGTAGVLYRGGPTGYRLALVAPVPADRRVRPAPRRQRRSSAAMAGADSPAEPHEPLTALLERLGPVAGGRALVVDAGRVVGIVTPSDVTRWIDVRRLAMPQPAVESGPIH